MKLTTNRNSKYYISHPHLYQVFINGQFSDSCTSVDSDVGYAVVHKTHDNGDYVIEDHEFVFEPVFGDIYIKVLADRSQVLSRIIKNDH